MADHGTTAAEPPKRQRHHWLRWLLGIILSLILILFIASFFLDEPLRRTTESKMNSHLKGYSVRLPKLHFQLLGLSLTLRGLTVRQDAHPNPPVAYFPYLKFSIHWREILAGKLVAEIKANQPSLHINLPQLETEATSKVPLKEKGWQQAVEAIYPLKVNRVVINDADITYVDQDPKRPLKLTHLNATATNIRNIHLPDKVYPSSFRVDTDIFQSGHGTITGKANFLAVPFPGMKSDFDIKNVPLAYFSPLVSRAKLAVEGGKLSTTGTMEISSKIEKFVVKKLTIGGMTVNYIHSAATAAAEKRRAAKAKKAAKGVSNKPGVELRVEDLNLQNCTFGMINRDSTPPYRIFISQSDLHLKNLSNHFSEGFARARLNGRFMGSGVTTATADFRPEKTGPDFDLYLKITDTQLTTMNDLLKSYAKFTVTAGTFSLVTELHVKNQAVTGYLKPFFKEIQVRKEPNKGPLHRIYEVLIQGVAKLLENRPHKAIATKADISGPLKSPQTSTVQILLELVRNAFFKAILPRFETEAAQARKR